MSFACAAIVVKYTGLIVASGNSDNSFGSMWLVVTVLAALGIAVTVLPKVAAVRPATVPAPARM